MDTPLAPCSLVRALALLLATLLASACDTGETTPDGPVFADDLVGRFQARDRYVPLAEALALTGLDRDLAAGTFTVLAPTRIALRYVGTDFAPVLFSDAERTTLRRVLRHHIVPGRLGEADFTDGAVLRDIDGNALAVRTIGPVVTVNGVTLDVDDPTEATNGVAYPLADVLFDTIEARERVRLSPLLAAFEDGLDRTGVATPFEALDAVTVLAPSEDAFRALGRERALLTASGNRDVYTRALGAHVLPGNIDLEAAVGSTVTTLAGDELSVTQDANRTLFVNGVRVLVGEVTADGRLYVLGEPILSTLTLAQRIRVRPNLTSYAAALERLPGTLERLGDRDLGSTVFAPGDFVYSSRSPLLQQTLAEPGQADLVRRFTGVHIVPQRLGAEDLQPGNRFTAFDGTVLSVERALDGRVLIESRFFGEPLQQANGALYTLATSSFIPNTNILDTALLSDSFVRFFRVVQREGLAAEYRTRARTISVLSDRDDLGGPGPVVGLEGSARARSILLRTATSELIPPLVGLSYPYAFTAINGDTRELYNEDGSYSYEPVVVFRVPPLPFSAEIDTLFAPRVIFTFFNQDRSQTALVLDSSDSAVCTNPPTTPTRAFCAVVIEVPAPLMNPQPGHVARLGAAPRPRGAQAARSAERTENRRRPLAGRSG